MTKEKDVGSWLLFLHNFFHLASSFTICRYLGYYQNVGVGTHSAGKSQLQREPRMQRAVNQQVLIKCLLLEVGHGLSACQRTQGLKEDFESVMLVLAFKFNLPVWCSLQAPQGGLPSALEQPAGLLSTITFSFYGCLPEAPSTVCHQMDWAVVKVLLSLQILEETSQCPVGSCSLVTFQSSHV